MPDANDLHQGGALDDPEATAEPFGDVAPPPGDDDAPGAPARTVIEGQEAGTDPAALARRLPWIPASADWLTAEPPRRAYLLHDRGDAVAHGPGLLPRGKVAILAAAGGVGKTFALCGLALAVVTGRRWLDYFPVGEGGTRRAVLVLGEEDPDELRRRLFDQARAMQLDARASAAAAGILALPGAGLDSLALTRSEEHDVLAGTPFAAALFAFLEEHAEREGTGWDVVILDPLSRFAGPDVETDNAAATRLVQVLERFTKLPGNPAVVVAHHTTKASRKADGEGAATTAVRGASGLTDGARWVAGLDPVDRPAGALPKLPPFARFRVTKNNYGRFPDLPDDGTLLLARADGGGLRVATDGERAMLRTAAESADKAAKSASKSGAAAPSARLKDDAA